MDKGGLPDILERVERLEKVMSRLLDAVDALAKKSFPTTLEREEQSEEVIRELMQRQRERFSQATARNEQGRQALEVTLDELRSMLDRH